MHSIKGEKLTAQSIRKFEKLFQRGDGCWEWTAYRDRDGYGTKKLRNKTVLAHRVAWAILHGDPGEMMVLHRCDNPSCVRPEHLFLGTAADNSADMIVKGRSAKGERQWKSKLTPERVREIRVLREAGTTMAALAVRFGVCQATISNVMTRAFWAHV